MNLNELLLEAANVDEKYFKSIERHKNPHRLIVKYANSSVPVKVHLLTYILGWGESNFSHKATMSEVCRDLNLNGYFTEQILIQFIQGETFPGIINTLLEWESESTVPIITPAVKLASVQVHGYNILDIDNPSPEMIKAALVEPSFINEYPQEYTKFVKEHFKDTSVLMNKWLRYAKNIREME